MVHILRLIFLCDIYTFSYKNETYFVCLFITVAVVVAFFICWAPFHAQRLVYTYFAGREHPSALTLRIFDVTTYISGILYHLSTCINPLLYNVMSNKFRQAFKVI